MTRLQQTHDQDGWVWCTEHRKRRYFTRRLAKKAQRLAAQSGLWRMSEVDVYECTSGDGLHIGHPSPMDLARKQRGAA